MANTNTTTAALKLTSLTAGPRPVVKNPLNIKGKNAQKAWDAKAARADAFVTGVAASAAASLTIALTGAAGRAAVAGGKLAVNKVKTLVASKKAPTPEQTTQQTPTPEQTTQQAPTPEQTTQQMAVDAEA